MTPRRLFLLPPALLLLLMLGVSAAGAVDDLNTDSDDGDDGETSSEEEEGEEETTDDASDDTSDEPVEPFEDVEDTGYEEAVTALAGDGVIEGCEEDRFCPDDPLTRGQAASLLVRAFELEDEVDQVESTELGEDGGEVASFEPFDDVAGTTHEDAINVLAATNYTQGCQQDAYCPSGHLTRAQVASLLDRALDPPPADGPFFDDVSEPHEPAINRLARIGVTAGCSDTLVSYCPGDDVTRGEVAVLLARSFGHVDLVELEPYEDRKAEQDAIDAEAEAQAEAEAEAETANEYGVPQHRVEKFERLAQCESNGNWQINTGNGFYGGLQFMASTWRSVGGSGLPHEASKAEQIYRGHILQQRSGWGQWPACTSMFGWR